MTSRKKSVDNCQEFEAFIEETADYLPPSKTKDDSNQDPMPLGEQNNKQVSCKAITKGKKKVYIGDLFAEPVTKEKMVNTTLQLPESLNSRLKTFCSEFGKSKNEVIKTLVEALVDEKGF